MSLQGDLCEIAYTIARFLLGAIFLFFGSNLFINFLHAPMPAGSWVIRQCAVNFPLHLRGRLLPGGACGSAFSQPLCALGLTLLAPVIVNICLVHILMAQADCPSLPSWLSCGFWCSTAFAPRLRDL